MGIGLHFDERDVDIKQKSHSIKDLDKGFGFYGTTIYDKRSVLDAFKVLCKKDKDWVIDKLKKSKYIS